MKTKLIINKEFKVIYLAYKSSITTNKLNEKNRGYILYKWNISCKWY